MMSEQQQTISKTHRSSKKQFSSEYGHFTEDGREYIITRPDTPRPWVNVIANPDYGFVVSQNGSGFSWRRNSQLLRLNRWEQDLIRDEYGKYFYLRDNESGQVWSPTFKPCNTPLKHYQVAYGQGYARFTSSYHGISHEVKAFVAAAEPVEFWVITVKNEGTQPRKLSLFGYLEWALAGSADTHREFHKTFIETTIDRKHNAVFGLKRQPLVPLFLSEELADKPFEGFLALTNAEASNFDGDKETFFGRYGALHQPKAVVEGRLENSEGKWRDAIAALQTDFSLEPGESRTLVFLMGMPDNKAHGYRLIKKYSTLAAVEKALEEQIAFWRGLEDDCQVETPDTAMNFMTNTWLKYQAVSGRIWGKTGYYQCSGAFGFRDQLQDSHIWLPLDPKLTRRQILLHAEQQFPDGTVHHWWHPNTKVAAVTDFSDDLLWLPYLTMNYLEETCDEAILDEVTAFLPPHGKPAPAQPETGTLYEHCVRAIERVYKRWSPRGLPLIGEGDWNDGLSHVGVKWKGESIWLGHFYYGILERFSQVAEDRGDTQRAQEYRLRAAELKEAINKHAWDGAWYICATRDDGRPLGSHTQPTGKIHLNPQTWALINGTASPERASIAMESARKHLYKNYGPLLLTPAYNEVDKSIGYITRYAPAIRENGGVYTHGATWAIQAECMVGNGDLAYDLYRRMCPILRGQDPDLYYAEPYVTPGNVDGPDSPNYGRGGWTWYTGSAAWLFKVAVDWILGVRPTREGLKIDPCIPKDWKKYTIRRKFRGATYEIEVTNPQGLNRGVKSIRVDGKLLDQPIIPPHKDGQVHQVKVVLGR